MQWHDAAGVCMQVASASRNYSTTNQPTTQVYWDTQGSFINASCAHLSMWSPTDSADILEAWTLVLISGTNLANITNADGSWSVDITQANLTASCKGATCNAAEDKWITVTNLDPTETYWLIDGPNHVIPGGSQNQFTYFLLQAFTAGETPSLQGHITAQVQHPCIARSISYDAEKVASMPIVLMVFQQ